MRPTVAGVLAAISVLCAPSVMAVQTVYTPPPGSAVRRAILDALRPDAEAELGGPVVFVVEELRVGSRYAYADVRPQRPGGRAYRIPRPELMDAYGGAVLEQRNGRWHVLRWVLGPTDVWQCEFAGRVPRAVLGDWNC